SNPADGSSYLPPGATFGRLNLPPEAEVFASSASGSAVGQLRTTERTLSSELVNVIRAFRYRPSYGLQVLGTLGGMNSAAYDVNNEGFIVGWSETAGSPESHAFLAAPGTGVTNPAAGHWVEINQLQMTDLGTLGGSDSAAYGINDAGCIVGKSDTTETIEHAFVYKTTGEMVDLNYLIDPNLGWRLTGAYDINNLGQIIAEGFVDGKKRVFLLTPRNPDDIYQAQVQFPDVMPTDWYFGDVMDLFSKGVLSGYPDGTFKPRNSVHVDEFISMTVTSLGHSNLDAGAAYWAGPSIERARQLGLVDEGEFTNYRRAITRLEMARILARAVGGTGAGQDNAGQIADLGTIAPDLRPYVVAAYSKGLVAGFPDGKFKPEGETTRVQAAVVIMRMIRTA
ncbi:MAG: S-layer homology domain-containing protein, partial [Desulfotomaculaceae bacterium]